MKLGALIVLYNPTNEQIKNCINTSNYFDKLVVIDNSENEITYIEDTDKIQYMKMNENVGLAKALNIGFAKLNELGFKWGGYLDQDTFIDETFREKYLDKLEYNNDVGVYTPQYLIDRKKDPILTDSFDQVVWTMTSASIFNVEIMKKINFFDERYFLDVVDYEYCLKCNKKDYKVMRYNGYAVRHNPGITNTTKLFKYKYGYMSPIRYYYQIRNLKLLYSEYKYKKIKLILLYKFLKVILLFSNKKEYLKMNKKAKQDYKNKRFYKINLD